MSTDLAAVGERIDALVSQAGPAADEAVRLVVDLYGAGLERLLEIAHDSGHLDDALLAALADDPLVSSLLLVHDLHPYTAAAPDPGKVVIPLESVTARIRAPRCELCSAPVVDSHSHVVDVAKRTLLCTCRPCYLLFTSADAHLAYRSVPDRYLALPDVPAALWDELELPVGTAFLLVSSALGRVVACYPGPAGATESELPLAAWDRLVAEVPALATLRPDVEALLVHTVDGRAQAHLVPVDVCYGLVGSLRQSWHGLDGGKEARAALAGALAQVRVRAVPA